MFAFTVMYQLTQQNVRIKYCINIYLDSTEGKEVINYLGDCHLPFS
jgi:hypothetical protein